MTLSIRHWWASHPGAVRTVNEDAYLCRPKIGLFGVVDGVGGAGGGGDAAMSVIRALAAVPEGLAPPDRLSVVRSSLQAVHAELQHRSSGLNHAVFATTIVMLLIEENHFACLWAGDSRAYLLRQGTMSRLTADHSAVQELVRGGHLSESAALRHPEANVITRAIGSGSTLDLDKTVGGILEDDRFLLCSDGLYKALAETEMRELLEGEGDVAQRLVAAALARRARDNVTAVVAVI